MRVIFSLAALCAGLAGAPALSKSTPYSIRSPDGRTTVSLDHNESGQLTYSIERNGETVITPSALRVSLAEGDISYVDSLSANPRSVKQVRKLVATKAAEANDEFNELTLIARPRSGGARSVQWIFRAYD